MLNTSKFIQIATFYPKRDPLYAMKPLLGEERVLRSLRFVILCGHQLKLRPDVRNCHWAEMLDDDQSATPCSPPGRARFIRIDKYQPASKFCAFVTTCIVPM
jgi:hypothetical protein